VSEPEFEKFGHRLFSFGLVQTVDTPLVEDEDGNFLEK
jgi:hypothetical protein